MENKQYTTREMFRRFAPYFKKYRFTLWMDLFCAALTTVCELVLPLIMRYITNEGLRDLASLSVKTILSLGVLYFGLRIVDCIAGYYMSDMGHVMGAKIETDMRRDAYNHLQKLSNTYYNNTKVGQIMGRITNDLFDVTEFAHHCPEEFFIAGIKTVISFVILANINLPLTLMIFLCVPLMCGVCMILNFRMRSAFRKQRNQIGELNARIEDSLLGHKVVKAFTNEEVENEKFEKDNGTFLDIKKLTYRYMAAFNTTVKLFDGLMYLVVLVAGGIFMVRGRIAAGDLVAYMLYVSTLIATIRRIIEFAEQFQRGMTGIERFLQIVDADIEIFDEPDAVELKDPKGEISFEKVSFEYPDDHNKVFTNLNEYSGNGSFEGWMRKIFINCALEKIRRSKVFPLTFPTEETEQETSFPNALEEISAQEMLDLIHRLPPGYQTIFNLFAIEGFSHKEIGAMLRITEGTSRSQYARARYTLQQMIKNLY